MPRPWATSRRLPWLSPGAASLVALARPCADDAWRQVRADPGAVLLIVRQCAGKLTLPSFSFFPSLLNDPAIVDGALRHLEHPTGFVAWDRPDVRPVYDASRTIAHLASALAERTGVCDPENAWVAGLLAPLGWLAVCAVSPERAVACRTDPSLSDNPRQTQEGWWGLRQAAIARRLAHRWQLPAWLTAVVGHLELHPSVALVLGAEGGLFRVVQLAVSLAVRRGMDLSLETGATAGENAEALSLDPDELATIAGRSNEEDHASPAAWEAPARVPLLRELLVLAAESRRKDNAAVLDSLEGTLDSLHRAFQDQTAGEEDRLKARKLRSLAEFAAGAGHEINNPLAVISGQAQYLLHAELDPGRQRALQAIMGQAQRIHQILQGLMQFARPPRPRKQAVDVGAVARQVAASLAELAGQRRVRLECTDPPYPVTLYADPNQLQSALTCLLRNAVEAAPADGWAGVRVELPAPDRVEFVVEDSGTGPTGPALEHLFDPFFSGRVAGRGRGLGLPTAWRLAREHGGDVRYDTPAGGPTRFVLTLPREPGTNGHGDPSFAAPLKVPA